LSGLSPFIANGDFEDTLTGWHIVGGSAFRGQPTAASSINAKDVEIEGKPVVPLGGNFWHTPYPIGQSGDALIWSIGDGNGILDSDPFTIALPYLAYRLGGRADPGVFFELRVPAATAAATPGFSGLDAPDQDGFVAVRRAAPSGSDVLHEFTWSLDGPGTAQGLLGAVGKIRLRVTGNGLHRLLVDDIRLLAAPPPPPRPKLWGWADLHCHPMAQAGFGGLLAGHMHGPVEDLGSCLQQHGRDHNDLLRPLGMLDGGRQNDGSLAAPGWAMGAPADEEQFGFRGWPAFDDITHIKVHQDWVRRAYDGGQRLMVALIVHSELLATFQGASQSDRDTVEPQIQMLKEFVAHNQDWCGIARTPVEARELIEHNRLAFVLGLETDSINGWIRKEDFPLPDEASIHKQLHAYFLYLRTLGIVQVNLLHLSDNAFGGMALYDLSFVLNTWARTGKPPAMEPVGPRADPDENINRRASVKSFLWGKIEGLALLIGWTPLIDATSTSFPPPGDRNAIGLTPAGKVAVLEAMRLGMVVDLDHMSELSAIDAHMVATGQPNAMKYPLISAHNGARRMAPRPLAALAPAFVPPTPALNSELRKGQHLWPNENSKSTTQLGFIKETGGMFGHGTAASDSRTWGVAVANDCPGSDKTFAQGYQYVHDQLVTDRITSPVGLGTDWNSLLAGPGPRFGTRAASGLAEEVELGDEDWMKAIRKERFDDATMQTAGVVYAPLALTDWREHRFANSGLYVGHKLLDKLSANERMGEGERMWQALAMWDAKVPLALAPVQKGPPGTVTLAAMGEIVDAKVRELALGMNHVPIPTSPYHRAGAIYDAPNVASIPKPPDVQTIVDGLQIVRKAWDAMRSGTNIALTRSMAGELRDFDYNLDGLAHYGMLPDMFQDLQNVGFPDLPALFGSAERYIEVWEASAQIGAALPHPDPL